MVVRAEEKSDSEKAQRAITKNIKLPFYDDDKLYRARSEPEPSQAVTTVESYVRTTRVKVLGVYGRFSAFNENVASKWNTAKAHTQGVVDFLQNEPELWQRCGIVAVAAFTGFLSGYRRSGLVKTRNMLVASGAAGAVCWPQQTVETTSNAYRYVKEPVAEWITQHAPGSPYIPVTTANVPPSSYYSNKPEADEDHGQSKSEDKDMYSTRGS